METQETLHVAIIPDGNRRWARANALEVWKGHEKGARRIRELSHAAFEVGVTHLTLWGSSYDNLTKRPGAETKGLISVYTHAISDMLKPEEHEVMRARVKVIGRWREVFPQELKDLIAQLEDVTAQYDEGRTLIVLLAYNGDDEILDAVQRMVTEGVEVTAQTLKSHLWTHDVPAVDLMVRTGGEPHLSAGFLMWDMANAHLHFTDTLFPDFTPEMLVSAIDEFNGRGRRLGA